jgi:hypothetical protein
MEQEKRKTKMIKGTRVLMGAEATRFNDTLLGLRSRLHRG